MGRVPTPGLSPLAIRNEVDKNHLDKDPTYQSGAPPSPGLDVQDGHTNRRGGKSKPLSQEPPSTTMPEGLNTDLPARTACVYCGASFKTFAGTRQHEKKSHPEEYNRDLETGRPRQESEMYATIARAEAVMRLRGEKYFPYGLVKDSGLTKDQIRHRRAKPVYQKYLEHAIKAAEKELPPPAPVVETQAEEGPLSSPTSRELARTEARLRLCEERFLVKDLLQESGVSKHYAKIRRDKPEYKEYLEKAYDEVTRELEEAGIVPRNGRIAVNAPFPSEAPRTDTSTPGGTTPALANQDKTTPAPELPDQVLGPASSAAEASICPERPHTPTEPQATPSTGVPGRTPLAPPDLVEDALSSTDIRCSPPIAAKVWKGKKKLSPRMTPGRRTAEPRAEPGADHPLGQPSSSPGPHFSQQPGPSGLALNPEAPDFRPAGGIPSVSPGLPTSLEEPTTTPHSGGLDIMFSAILQMLQEDLPEDITNLARVALNGDDTATRTAVDGVISARFSATKSTTRSTPAVPAPNQEHHNLPRRRNYNYGRQAPARDHRVESYKKAQDLYEKARPTLVGKIISGEPLQGDERVPRIEDIEKHFGTNFEMPSPVDDEKVTPTASCQQVLTPITSEEVSKNKLNWKNSAPGPDRLTVSQVKSVPDKILAAIFNVILFTGVVPTAWRTSRTILIHKEGDRENPVNWRPLTISSSLMRLFHRILASKIRAFVTMNASQRGFRDIDGTMANCLILEEYMKSRRLQGKSHAVLTVDISKAFDTVSHWSLLRAMRRFMIAEPLVRYIMANITTATTTIKMGNESTRPIQLNRGVKQGDPLSPLLFNLVVDELLSGLERDPTIGGTISSGIKVPAMAFADDVVLMEDNEVNVPMTLGEIVSFCRGRGMALNASKCTAMVAIAKNKKIAIKSKNNYTIDGKPVRDITVVDTFKYLGHEYSGQGVLKPNLANLSTWLVRIERAPLKPDQKASIVRDFVIPKLMYGLQNARVTGKVLREADRLIKHRIKRFLHLSSHTPDQYLYAGIRDGGLGISQLRFAIPKIMIGRITKLESQLEDLPLRHALEAPGTVQTINRIKQLAGTVPLDQHWRTKIKESTFSRGLEQAADNTASRGWIRQKPSGWTGRDYVRAVQLRTNNLPTAGLPSNPPELRGCRGGCSKVETLCHVIQGCPVTHYPRITRHNEVANKIRDHCKRKGWKVDQEPHVRHQDGTLFRPDLVIHQPDKSIVCDVQVAWDGDLPLATIYENKRAVYDNDKFCEAAQRKWPQREFLFAPYILGTRGIYPKCDEETSALIDLPQAVKNSTIHSVLKWGSTIHNHFMRQVWRRRPGERGWGTRNQQPDRTAPRNNQGMAATAGCAEPARSADNRPEPFSKGRRNHDNRPGRRRAVPSSCEPPTDSPSPSPSGVEIVNAAGVNETNSGEAPNIRPYATTKPPSNQTSQPAVKRGESSTRIPQGDPRTMPATQPPATVKPPSEQMCMPTEEEEGSTRISQGEPRTTSMIPASAGLTPVRFVKETSPDRTTRWGVVPPASPSGPSDSQNASQRIQQPPIIDPMWPPAARLTRQSADSEGRYVLARLRQHNFFQAVRLYLAYLHDQADTVCVHGETRTSVRLQLASEGFPTERNELLGLYNKFHECYGLSPTEASADLKAFRSSVITERTNYLQRAREATHKYFQPMDTRRK